MTKEALQDEARKFLDEQVTAVLATVSIMDKPRAATMYFYTDNDFNFYFLTARDSHKLKNIEKNNNVAIVVGFGPQSTTVQAGGTAETNLDFNEEFIDKVFKKTEFHNPDQWPVLRLEKTGLVMIKVTPTWMTFLNFEKHVEPDMQDHHIYTLIP